ncbi:MAG: hypothetical protein WA421_02160 [Nitrososphaeraceae archaeon]
MKSIGAVIVGLVLVAGSLYFVYPYADFTPKVQHAHVTAGLCKVKEKSIAL